jgi:hypothetical protein
MIPVTEQEGEAVMEEAMSYHSRQEYLRTQRTRYQRAGRAEKRKILDEGCALFRVHRKSLIRAFSEKRAVPQRRRGPKRRYGPEVCQALKKLWLKARQPCAKRLKPMLLKWLPHYERHYGAFPPDVREKLLSMSASTLDRLLRPIRAKRRKGLCATRSARHIEGQIPIRTRFQEVDGPGFFEMDTVAHCGTSMAGHFVWSLTFTDVWSGWTENRAIWNRNVKQIVERLRDIEERLAFEVEGVDSDNGSEFLNHQLLRYLRERRRPVEFTRSRPYRKNDNAHVEQKQWTHVRELLGYDRLEDRRLVRLINDLYRHEWRALQNFFLPSMRLISKTREGGHLRRHHGPPQTPYERLLSSPKVLEEDKQALRREYENLDPIVLVETVEHKLRAILRLVRRQPLMVRRKQQAA